MLNNFQKSKILILDWFFDIMSLTMSSICFLSYLLTERRLVLMNEKLFDFVSSLTEKEVEKIVSHFPELISLLEEPIQPCHREQFPQTE